MNAKLHGNNQQSNALEKERRIGVEKISYDFSISGRFSNFHPFLGRSLRDGGDHLPCEMRKKK